MLPPCHTNPRRIVYVCLCLLALTAGCNSNVENNKSSSEPSSAEKSDSTPPKPSSPEKKTASPAPSPNSQTLYEGKTLNQWISLLGEGVDGKVASEVLMLAGNDAVPELLATLQSGDGDRRKRVMVILRDGPAKGDPRVIDAFIAAVADEDLTVRNLAISALRDTVVKRPQIVAALAARLQVNSKEWGEQLLVMGYLRDLGPYAASATEAVAKILADDERKFLRRWALATVLTIGGDRSEVSNGLVAALSDVDEGVRDVAYKQILRLKPGPRAKQVYELLVDLLDSNDLVVNETTRNLLIQLGARVVPRMIEALDDPRLSVRQRAVFVLGKIGPSAKAALKPLKQKLNDNDKLTRELAKRAIDKINGKL